jgi:hypothetical protein
MQNCLHLKKIEKILQNLLTKQSSDDIIGLQDKKQQSKFTEWGSCHYENNRFFSQKGLDFTVNCNVIMVQKEVGKCLK